MTKRFSDDQSQSILKRALEIDAQAADGLSSAQLEAVASELGISPLALAKAMNEHGVSMVTRGAHAPIPVVQTQASWAKPAAAVAIVLIAAFTVLAIVFTRPPTTPAVPTRAVTPAAPAAAPPAPPIGSSEAKAFTKATKKKAPTPQ